MLSRREVVTLAAAGGIVSGCAPLAARLRHRSPESAFALPNVPTEAAARFWGRVAFGHRPEDLHEYVQVGHDEMVDSLLRADRAEDPALIAQISRLEAFRMNSVEMEDLHREEVIRQLQQAALLRAVYGANPLLERMCDFWSDHFNVYGAKGEVAWRTGEDVDSVIRKHALGNFGEMLRASARSPAMLAYLDNQVNRSGHANENYARELMELHTLGVDGGYTQKDIQEVARCFTGWTVENRFLRRKGTFRFDPDVHDTGSKTLLGHRIEPSGGESDGAQVLEILIGHASTARFLARKLVRYFLGVQNPEIEAKVADAYSQSRGDIPSMLRPILKASVLLAGPPILKRPLDLAASALRALDGNTDGGAGIQAHVTAMGQAPYGWPMPDGYPVKPSAWSGSMLPRWNFAFALAGDRIRGTSIKGPDLDLSTRVDALFGQRAPREIHSACARDGLALAIAAPEFQWR